jgi:hypothetical protein
VLFLAFAQNVKRGGLQMSEMGNAGVAQASASQTANQTNDVVTPGTGSVNASKTQSQHETQSQSGKEIIPTHGSKEPAKADKTTKEPNQSSEEFEEIALGSVKGKVPKQIADAIKNFERGFQSKAQKAAQMEKLVTLGKENPKEFLKQTGINIHEFAETILAERFEEMQMTPEQKQQREEKAELERLRSIDRASKQELIEQLKQLGDQIPQDIEKYPKEEIQRYVQHRQAQYRQEAEGLDQEIGQAFSESGLPADKYTLAKVAFEISSAAKQGKNLSAKEALARVSQGYYEGTREHFSKMDGKRIHELLGDAVLDKIRKYDLERVTTQAASQFGQNQTQGQGQNPSSQNGQPKKQLNQAEWRKAMGIG